MTKTWIKRGFIIAGSLLLGLFALSVSSLIALGIPHNAAGMAAKEVCSAAFVAGRPWANLLADDIVPANPALIAIGILVDEKNKAVTARFAGLFARQARLLPDRGCVLDVNSANHNHMRQRQAAIADTGRPWPQGEAPLVPADWGAGVDADALQKLVRDAFVGAGDVRAANTRGIAIVYKGRLLVLRTAPGFDASTPLHGWSMTKTVLGMLTYKLAAESGLSFDTPVIDAFARSREPGWVAAWRGDARRYIKVSDLLYMRDGLASTEDYGPWGSVPKMLWGRADTAAFAAASLAEATPGQRWRYLSQTANLLSALDRSRVSSDAEYWAYPAKSLFAPIGARTAVLETDTAGNWVGSSYLWASVGDWARLGQLMLADGRWGDKQVLPPGWLKFASTRSTAQGEGRGYGAHSWLIGDPNEGDCKSYGLPADTIAMSGHFGQVVAMVPSREAVIVRLGWTFRRDQFDSCAFVAAALKALPELAGVDAAVDVERGAGNEAVILAGKKHGGTRNIIGIAAATERYAGHRGPGGLRGRVGVVKTGAENHAGREGVDAHALRTEFVGQRARKRENGAFRGRVDQRTGMAAFAARERGQVDDAGATAGLRSSHEVRCGGARDAAGATDIERHDVRPERVVGLGQCLARHQRTGVVHQHIQSTEKLHRFAHEPFALGRFGEIGGSVSVASAERFRFSLQSAGGIRAAAIVNEYVAAGRE